MTGKKRHRIDPRSIQTPLIKALHEEPRPQSWLVENDLEVTTYQRQELVGSIRAPAVQNTGGRGGNATRGRATTVRFLYGDERRAIRTFIKANEDFVASCMEDTSNRLSTGWPDWQWNILCEEWQFHQHAKGDE